MNYLIASKSIVYYQKEILGQGLSSCVYKAIRKDQESGFSQTVAIKILNSRILVKNWGQEYLSLMRVKSKNCVSVLNWERLNGQLALILEFLDGVTLEQLVSRTTLTQQEIEYIIYEIHRGLIDLRQAGLCHGDLSLKNIMLTQRGEVKLIDFGLANYTSEQILATPQYLAPEIYQTYRPNYYSDLYSLGIIAKRIGGNSKLYSTLLNVPASERWMSQKQMVELPPSLVEKVSQQVKICQSTSATYRIPLRGNKLRFLHPLLILLFLVFVVSSVQSESIILKKWGRLSVNTNRWVFIEINHRPLGYAPLNKYPIETGHFKVKWRTSRGSGERVLTLNPDQHIVLKDDFFKIK